MGAVVLSNMPEMLETGMGVGGPLYWGKSVVAHICHKFFFVFGNITPFITKRVHGLVKRGGKKKLYILKINT